MNAMETMERINLEGDYLLFGDCMYANLKTRVISVSSKKGDFQLGQIRWFPRWGQYVFLPENAMVFNPSCLKEIIQVIEALMNDRKVK